MKLLLVFIKKELFHMFRDRKVLLILFGMPVVQVLLFGFALSNEIKETPVALIDNSKDQVSRQLGEKIAASRFFRIEADIIYNDLDKAFQEGLIRAAVVFPENFAKSLAHDRSVQVQLITDATDLNYSDQITSYINSIINDHNASSGLQVSIIPEVIMLYNPHLKGAPNFVPGVMAMVLLLVCVMMTAISIVKEKETGTMEVLLVSPMKPLWVVLSKAIPYFILSLVNLIAILIISIYVLNLPVKGSMLLLLAESMLFIITSLTLGIVISNRARTQEVAMLISLVGMMMPTMILSGFMFPIENMPLPLQVISSILPSKWYYIIVKAIMVKGAGFMAVWKETLILLGLNLILLIVSIRTFKMRLQ